MGANDSEERTTDEASARGGEREESGANVASRASDSEPHPPAPRTMQRDHAAVPGRQRYAHARAGDYSPDFQEDGSGSHPVKPTDSDQVDEDDVPKIAARKPHEGDGD